MSTKSSFLTVGALGGALVGYMTRPTLLGVKVPLEVLFSKHPADAALRSDMFGHMAIAIGVGLVVGWIAQAVAAGQGTDKATPSYDVVRWKALLDIDPDVAKAAETARDCDPECEVIFARNYLALEANKAYLDAALKQALDEFEVRKRKADDMAAISIRWTSTERIGGLEFRHGVAQSRHGESKILLQAGIWTVNEGYKAGNQYLNEAALRAALAE